MTQLISQLGSYAGYHRDRRNVATHLLGIPLIVLAVTVLLARPALAVAGAGMSFTPSMIVAGLVCVYYVRLEWRLGLTMVAVLAIFVALGKAIAAVSALAWLGGGAALFVAGWGLQFLGHQFEGRKPAFLDDLRGLVIGPLFVVAEIAFMFGLRKDLRAAIAAVRR